MKKFLNSLIQHQSLTASEAHEAVSAIASGLVNPSQTAAFLMGIQQKGITVDELDGFRNAMLDLATDIGFDDIDAIDVCGTGGDGKDTFNISTTSAFIIAGAGVKVAKHGNHGVSSLVGSSTVLEYLGIPFTNDKDFLRQKIETAGICYLHAPLFHPAMKFVAPIRKELGIKTFFNILGPLLNPAKVRFQLTGVSDLSTFELYHQLFQKQAGRFAVIHALDGYDEISMTGDFKVAHENKVDIFSPSDWNLPLVNAEDLSGGKSLKESADILIRVLRNEGTTAQNTAVLANAGLGISVAKGISIEEGISQAKESLQSRKALKALQKLVE